MLGLLFTTFASAGIKFDDVYSTPTIYLETPPSVRIYEDFTVSIKVADVINLWAWQVRLQFDSSLMEFVSSAEGELLKTGGTTAFVSVHDLGGVWLAAHLTDTLNGVSGSGTLANVTLHCIGQGSSALNFLQTRLFNDTLSVPWNGYGDADGDGRVDIKDLLIVSHAIFTSIGDPLYDPAADFNGDGLVDYFDMMCVRCNFGRMFPDPSLIPVGSAHNTLGAWIRQRPEFPVSWRWVNADGLDVWYTAYVGFEISDPVESSVQNFVYTQPLDYVSFDISSNGNQYCTVTIPKLFMSGAFQLSHDNFLVPYTLTWNKTHTQIQFEYDIGLHHFKIRGEIATKIRGLWSLSDVNGDGIVDIFDIVRVALDMSWHEP